MTEISNPWTDETAGGFGVRSAFPGGACAGGSGCGGLGLGDAGAPADGALVPSAVYGLRRRHLMTTPIPSQPVPGVLPARRQVLSQL